MKKNNYDLLFEELKSGKNLNLISKEKKICRKNLKTGLYNKFGKKINKYIYGEIIANINNFKYYKIPNNQTNKNECNITKQAKQFLINKYSGLEEVGIWLNNYSKRYVVDVYSIKHDIAFEIHWNDSINYKKLKIKLLNYSNYFNNVVCVLLKNSEIRKENKIYPLITKKLKSDNISYIILDVTKTPTICETRTFPMELLK